MQIDLFASRNRASLASRMSRFASYEISLSGRAFDT
jgi:hypothetical protein